jgi:broad specificity phosphatase PhoE
MQLFMIRHGKPKVVNNNFYEARLSEEGRQKAMQLALSGQLPTPDVVLSSPYIRAVDTATAICNALGVGFEIREFLKEWNLQSLNLLDPEYTTESVRGWAEPDRRVKGGESLSNLEGRAIEGILLAAGMAKEGQVIYLITHGTLIEVVCARVRGRPASRSNVEEMEFLRHAELRFDGRSLALSEDPGPQPSLS